MTCGILDSYYRRSILKHSKGFLEDVPKNIVWAPGRIVFRTFMISGDNPISY